MTKLASKPLTRPLLDPAEIEEVFLIVLSKTRELRSGEHQSLFTGTSGLEFASLREKEPGDPLKNVDWARSSTTGFNPLIIKETVEDRVVRVILVLDASLSTRFGINGIPIGRNIAKVAAVIGFSAAIFQDPVAQFTFSEEKFGFEEFGVGKNHVFYLIGLYQNPDRLVHEFRPDQLASMLVNEIGSSSLIVFISDFLSSSALPSCRSLQSIASYNDVVVFAVEASFAFELPPTPSSWIEVGDVSGRRSIVSIGEARQLKSRVEIHQRETVDALASAGFETILVNPAIDRFASDLFDFFLERRTHLRNFRI